VPDGLLVLGGTRSGKSRFALEQARARGGDAVTFVATARRGEPELDVRIAVHRAERPAVWRTVEIEHDLSGALPTIDRSHVVLVDSLSLWVAALIDAGSGPHERWAEVARALDRRERAVIFVSDEVGLGLVPVTQLARRFVDELGWLNQQVAEWCDEVRLTVAGIAVLLKGAA
jgi:adenosyl cobinamide kinase/adenosyl cobinamide phosphate guanylyltransferase